MINIPKKTKAAILVKLNSPLIIDEIELPSELFPGQVLVEVISSGICGSQLGEISGVKGEDRFLPHLMGHEGCANVIETGPGVSNITKGDRVVLHWMKGEGIQSEPAVYGWHKQKLNAGWVTTFNKLAIVSENRCTKISKNVDPVEASLFGCAITTGFGVIENDAKIRIGESIVIFGSGGIGLNVIQAAKLRSANPIIAVDQFDNRLNLAKKIGATHTINTRRNNFEEEIKKILKGKYLDVFIDNTGNSKIIELGYKVTNFNGRIVLVGVPRIGDNINIYSLPLHFGKLLIGSHGGGIKPSEDIPRFINMLLEKKFEVKNLITNRFKFNEINQAIDLMKNGKSDGRVVLDL